jgi:hypothetical protein
VHGAGEVVRGKIMANIASLAREESIREIEEETVRRGKREMFNQEFEPKPQSPGKVSRKEERKREKREKSST